MPFKRFSQDYLEAESVFLAAQEGRNTSNTNPSKKLNFSPSQSNVDNVGQESRAFFPLFIESSCMLQSIFLLQITNVLPNFDLTSASHLNDRIYCSFMERYEIYWTHIDIGKQLHTHNQSYWSK